MAVLQKRLIRSGQYIPGIRLEDEEDLARKATLSVSSTLSVNGLPANGGWKDLSFATAQILPLKVGRVPGFTFQMRAEKPSRIKVALLKSKQKGNFTPELILAEKEFELTLGEQSLLVDFEINIEETEYYFVAFYANETVQIRTSETRMTGLLTVFQKYNKAVATSSRQEAPDNIGMESFDFWLPERRPGGQNLAFTLDQPLTMYDKTNLVNGIFRPYITSNAWAADQKDSEPFIELKWGKKQDIREIYLFFDTDFDHALESTLMGHPESEIPFCVNHFKICDDRGNCLADVSDNHQTRFQVKLSQPVTTQSIKIILRHPSASVPAALFGILCY